MILAWAGWATLGPAWYKDLGSQWGKLFVNSHPAEFPPPPQSQPQLLHNSSEPELPWGLPVFSVIVIIFWCSYTNKLVIIPAPLVVTPPAPGNTCVPCCSSGAGGPVKTPRQHPHTHGMVEMLVPAVSQICEDFPGARQRILGSCCVPWDSAWLVGQHLA